MQKHRHRLFGQSLAAKYWRRCLLFCGVSFLIMFGLLMISWRQWIPHVPWGQRIPFVMIFFQLAIPGAIILTARKVHSIRGHCWRCGYARDGLSKNQCCPECGAEAAPTA